MKSSRKRHLHDYRVIDGCFHRKLEIHCSSNLPNKQKHSAFTQTKISLVWWSHHARGINIIGSKMVTSTKNMSKAVFQIEKICVQGNKNFLVFRMQLNNKDRHDNRFSGGCFHEFVAIHINNSFQVKRRNQHSNKYNFLSLWRHHANSTKVIIESHMVTPRKTWKPISLTIQPFNACW